MRETKPTMRSRDRIRPTGGHNPLEKGCHRLTSITTRPVTPPDPVQGSRRNCAKNVGPMPRIRNRKAAGPFSPPLPIVRRSCPKKQHKFRMAAGKSIPAQAAPVRNIRRAPCVRQTGSIAAGRQGRGRPLLARPRIGPVHRSAETPGAGRACRNPARRFRFRSGKEASGARDAAIGRTVGKPARRLA